MHRNLDRLVLRNVSFGHSSLTVCMPAYKVAKVAGPRNNWPDEGPSRERSMMQDFRQSSEAVG